MVLGSDTKYLKALESKHHIQVSGDILKQNTRAPEHLPTYRSVLSS